VVAGDGMEQSKDGTVTDCSFDYPEGIAVDETLLTLIVKESEKLRLLIEI
jgi:hypothetical protein